MTRFPFFPRQLPWIWAALAFGPALLAGCLSGALGVRPAVPTQFYLLNPAGCQAPLAGEHPGLLVEISGLGLPQYLEKPQIIVRTRENRLALAEYHQWGGNLRKNMIRVMAQNLSCLLGTPRVVMAPFRSQDPDRFRIQAEVMQFEADLTGQVRLKVQWRLFRGGARLATRMSDLAAPLAGPGKAAPAGPGVDSPDFDALVSTMDHLLGEWGRVMAREVLTHFGKVPGP